MRIELWQPLCDPAAFAAACGAEWRAVGAAGEIGGLTNDAREVQKGDVFVALTGRHTTGTAYLPQALANGAAGMLIPQSTPLPAGDYHAFLVSDPANALLSAAAARRAAFRGKVIAVSGSVGKTTLKETLLSVLSTAGRAVGNKGNFNSTVGMPLSVLSLSDADFAVLELGVNHKGEMEKMSRALAPDLAVLTAVGTAHIGAFGTYEALAAEKLNIAAGLAENGTLVLPQELLPFAPTRKTASVGGAGADFRAENVVIDENGIKMDLCGANCLIEGLCWRIPGQAGVRTLSLAGAVGALLGIGAENIRRGVAAVVPPRPKLIPCGRQLLIDDTYNASPEAMVAALETLCYLSPDRPRVAVLGDMRELGEKAATFHRAVGEYAAQSGLSALFTYGAQTEIAAGARRAGLTRVASFSAGQSAELACAVAKAAPPDAAILFKGSRALQMENIVTEVRKYHER